jgi:hypothetical protein
MPWDQIVTAVAVIALGIAAWLYLRRPEPPRDTRTYGPQVPLGR